MSLRTTISRGTAALRSGRKAAYLGILLRLLRPFTIIIDKLFNPLPKKFEKLPPIIFITSPPRSGSTIIYQVLVRKFRCVYFSNLHFLFPRNASRWFFGKETRKEMSLNSLNYYGYTSSIRDVNEGNETFDKIFGQEDTADIRRSFIEYLECFGLDSETPVLIKNVRNYRNLDKIKKAIPEIKFLRIQRDLFQNIQSEYLAYKELKTFHPIPDELKDIDYHKDPLEFAVLQILSIGRKIKNSFSKIDNESYMNMEYENFCLHPEEWFNKISDLSPTSKIPIRKKINFSLNASEKIKVSKSEAEKIKNQIESFERPY